MTLSHISEHIPTVVAQAKPKRFKPADAALMDFEEVQAMSPSEQIAWLAARWEHKTKQAQAQREASQSPKSYKCRFCLDQTFIFVLPIWHEFSCFPKQFTREQIALVQHSNTSNIAMPCECHPTLSESFYNRFGEKLSFSLFGRSLVYFRKEIALQREQEVKKPV